MIIIIALATVPSKWYRSPGVVLSNVDGTVALKLEYHQQYYMV